MLIGLLSDTHDHLPAVRELVRQFSERGASMILHAGDYCSPFTLDTMLEAQIPLVGVFGRNDGDHSGLRARASASMGELYESPHSVEIAGRRILLLHLLHDTQERSIDKHDVVVHGGTHRYEVRHRSETLIINPGEGCGWITGTPSAAILDLESRQVEILTLPPLS